MKFLTIDERTFKEITDAEKHEISNSMNDARLFSYPEWSPMSPRSWLNSMTSPVSGSIWVKQVVKITPAPKQFKAVTNKPAFELLLLSSNSAKLNFSDILMGTRPKKSDKPPKIIIDPILAARWSSMVDVQGVTGLRQVVHLEGRMHCCALRTFSHSNTPKS